jgi:hypothetical protein
MAGYTASTNKHNTTTTIYTLVLDALNNNRDPKALKWKVINHSFVLNWDLFCKYYKDKGASTASDKSIKSRMTKSQSGFYQIKVETLKPEGYHCIFTHKAWQMKTQPDQLNFALHNSGNLEDYRNNALQVNYPQSKAAINVIDLNSEEQNELDDPDFALHNSGYIEDYPNNSEQQANYQPLEAPTIINLNTDKNTSIFQPTFYSSPNLPPPGTPSLSISYNQNIAMNLLDYFFNQETIIPKYILYGLQLKSQSNMYNAEEFTDYLYKLFDNKYPNYFTEADKLNCLLLLKSENSTHPECVTESEILAFGKRFGPWLQLGTTIQKFISGGSNCWYHGYITKENIEQIITVYNLKFAFHLIRAVDISNHQTHPYIIHIFTITYSNYENNIIEHVDIYKNTISNDLFLISKDNEQKPYYYDKINKIIKNVVGNNSMPLRNMLFNEPKSQKRKADTNPVIL